MTDPRADAGDDEPNSDEVPTPKADPPRARHTGQHSAGGVVLAAAMLGLGEALEPDKTEVVIEQRDDRDHNPDADVDLSFGHLPPLNEN